MNELIKVEVKADTQVVSARELYKGLEIKRRFSAWVSDNFKDFIEDVDFTSVRKSTEVKNNGGIQIRELQDYAITISMAKELCMMSHTELGKEYRKYFLELERKWNDPKEVVKRGYAILQNENKQLKIENGILKPKADKYDRYLSNKGLITITEIAKEYGMSGVKLNQFLRDKRVIYKRGNKWFVYQKYANERYVGYEIHLPEGRRSLKWTPEGEMFIRELLENNNIKPVLEQPQQLTVQETVKYSGKYYTASSIAYNLGLSEEWIMKIGEIANNLKLKPRFSDENIYCRKTLDDNGFPRWEYTQYGAALIENEINKFRLANQI
ncbi:phage antirepressor KilAC domain-containing protein [Ligilactobacillus salivarius]|uniref:Phage antirepressor KilAC domain-containing protein n=1 Tax=Ligilactobacillus salivarius TaxID=1624 RepID=A0AAW6Q3K5_9LACO|nr:phage antirepressor KilAC domain-containing protein [Ligilactobacillus salivarius]MDF4186106.1 phage antirepressor KilAC domain-containing protein [Ligilactobacillus salivarius]